MDIAAALVASAPTGRVGKCLLQRRIDSIPEDTDGRGDLLDAIESPEWSAPQIATVLGRLGLPVSATTIRQHRAGTCPCCIGG